MATRHVQKVLSPRNRGTSLDVERENFEKCQITSISKAVNGNESPVKEKHVRTIIMGTYKDKNYSMLFWQTVRKLPLQENPIVCWKFCHVLHKVLREGTKRVIPDAYAYRGMILNLGKMWGLLKEGYGKLIQNYCSLLVNKIDFHARNERFPGNLMVTDDELDNIGERDVNVFFQLSCEMFDYLDEILTLQAAVFGSLDMSRASSMTSAGQCRLAPLICCIQDSSQLYDYSVKVLFKLHAALPAGTLDGHRSRFLQQFKLLKQFYINSANLQYFKNLIQVPLLPEKPPNLLLASDIKTHVTPVVIVPKQPDSPDGSVVDSLIDLSLPQNDSRRSSENPSEWSFSGEKQNGTHAFELVQEKERVINQLSRRIEELEIEIQQVSIEDSRIIDSLKKKAAESESRMIELERNLSAIREDKDNFAKELDEVKQELSRHKAGTDTQTELAKASEKFQKLKDIYQQLRSEHIELLRSKAEVEKTLVSANNQIEKLSESNQEIIEQLSDLKRKHDDCQQNNESFQELTSKAESLEIFNKKLLSEMALLQQEKLQIEHKLNDVCRNEISLKKQLLEEQETMKRESQEKGFHYLGLIVKENCEIVTRVVNEDDIVPMSRNVTCTPEYFFAQCDLLQTFVGYLVTAVPKLHTSEPEFDNVLCLLVKFFHQLVHVFNCGRVVYQTLPNIELGQDLMNRCKDLMNHAVHLSEDIKNRSDCSQSLQNLEKGLNGIRNLKSTVVPESNLNATQNLEELLLTELSDMDKAIQDAANRIEQMMNNAKKRDTGVKLEVNGKILDACTLLMQRIIELVKNSKELQNEIVAQGKGSVSLKEFYQRNHRWTEGLISAAKVVALAAKLLVDAADKVVSGKAKFEELMVASQEIAAATAQLVVASRVKADKDSAKMAKVSSSSKRVTEATGTVVATAKSCAQLIDESETEVDFSKLTLHQAKRLEMESQVRVIELETELAKERMRLGGLRKRHYHLGGASEGWE